jgi:hypothetical protein
MASRVPTPASPGKLMFISDLIDKNHVSVIFHQLNVSPKFSSIITSMHVWCAPQQRVSQPQQPYKKPT